MQCMYGCEEEWHVRNRLIRLCAVTIFVGLIGALSVTQVAAASMVAHVVGGGIQFDGNGFYRR